MTDIPTQKLRIYLFHQKQVQFLNFQIILESTIIVDVVYIPFSKIILDIFYKI